MPKLGDVIGRFTLERELGRGPMSEVFLALEAETRWKVAFKFFLLEPGSKPADRALWAQRMLREARAAAEFHHEHTVRVHEVGEREGAPYLVRDFIEGRSLAEYVGDRSPGALGRKPRVASRPWPGRSPTFIARGLVHRDVKPATSSSAATGRSASSTSGVARRSIDRAAGIALPRTDRVRTTGAPGQGPQRGLRPATAPPPGARLEPANPAGQWGFGRDRFDHGRSVSAPANATPQPPPQAPQTGAAPRPGDACLRRHLERFANLLGDLAVGGSVPDGVSSRLSSSSQGLRLPWGTGGGGNG